MEPVGSSVGVFGLLSLVVLALGAMGTIFWIWMLAECATRERSEGNRNRLNMLGDFRTLWLQIFYRPIAMH